MNPAVSPAHAGYLRRETAISAAINSLLSLLFFVAVFHGQDPVMVWGTGGWVLDCVPQGFMIGFMSTLVPGILTRRRLAAGAVAPLAVPSLLPRRVLPRAVLVGAGLAVLGTLVVGAIAAGLGVEALSQPVAGAIKVIYGALLATLVTPPTLRAALVAA